MDDYSAWPKACDLKMLEIDDILVINFTKRAQVEWAPPAVFMLEPIEHYVLCWRLNAERGVRWRFVFIIKKGKFVDLLQDEPVFSKFHVSSRCRIIEIEHQ